MCLHTLLAEPSWPSVSHPVPMPEVTEPLIIAVSHLLTNWWPTLSLPGLQIYWSVDNPSHSLPATGPQDSSTASSKAASSTTPPRDLDADFQLGWELRNPGPGREKSDGKKWKKSPAIFEAFWTILNLSASWIFRELAELDAFISTAATWKSLEWPLFKKLGALQHPSCLDMPWPGGHEMQCR